jgi:hypothetical protein
MRDNFIAPLPAENRVPYWFTDTKLIKPLNYASIMLAKWDIRYVFFAVLFGGGKAHLVPTLYVINHG